MSRPGGNVTAVTAWPGVVPKRLRCCMSLLRWQARSPAVHPAAPTPTAVSDIAAAVSALGLKLKSVPAGSERDLAAATEALGRMPAAALLIGNDSFFLRHTKELGALSVRLSVPAAFEHPEFALPVGFWSMAQASWIPTAWSAGCGPPLQGNRWRSCRSASRGNSS